MTPMRLRVFWDLEGNEGYAWDLVPVRAPKISYPHILGRTGFKTTAAAQKNAHAFAGKHNFRIVKREEIRG